MMDIKIKKILDDYSKDDVKLPLITEGNACYDFYAPAKFVIYPGEHGIKIPSGLAFEIPEGYCMMLFMRSSYGAKRELRLSNAVGVIDSSYRGEVQGLFDNIGDKPEIIEKGERFMQGKLVQNIPIRWKEVQTLTDTQRGEGGFGSTGK